MTFQSILLQVRGYLSVPRLLLLLNVALMCSLAWMIGSTAALIIENELLEVPYRESKFVSLERIKAGKSRRFDEFQAIIDMNVFDAEVSTEKISVFEEPVESQPGEILKQILSDLQLMGFFYIRGKAIYCTLKMIGTYIILVLSNVSFSSNRMNCLSSIVYCCLFDAI